jgi:hypothetical protein
VGGVGVGSQYIHAVFLYVCVLPLQLVNQLTSLYETCHECCAFGGRHIAVLLIF